MILNETKSVDCIILGTGVSGLHFALNLHRKGIRACVIDPHGVASGASGTPLALANPATGRWGNKVWQAEECFRALRGNLEWAQAHTEATLYKQTGILRPALKPKIARRMKENVAENDWPENHTTWVDESFINNLNPGLNCVDGGMWLPGGLTINTPDYLKALAGRLQAEGTDIIQAGYSVHKENDRWECTLETNGQVIRSPYIVYAIGAATVTHPMWEFLGLHPVKGQNLELTEPTLKSMDYSVSALGYIATLEAHRYVLGSTYEHDFEHTEADEEGRDYLLTRMRKVYPELIDRGVVSGQWAGVRVSTPNRKPVAGFHPVYEGAAILSGMGSKGLLYSSYTSAALARHIFEGEELPGEVDIGRFQ